MQHLRHDHGLFVTGPACRIGVTKGREGYTPRPFRYAAMVYVQSSALAQLSYDGQKRILRATFRATGRTYLYRGVPQEIYDGLMFADSIGAYFNAHIRDHYPFEEID